MWFDVQAELEALGETQNQHPHPAIPAIPAIQEGNSWPEAPQLAGIAGIAVQTPSNTESLLGAIEASHAPQSKWQARAGALSSHTGLFLSATCAILAW